MIYEIFTKQMKRLKIKFGWLNADKDFFDNLCKEYWSNQKIRGIPDDMFLKIINEVMESDNEKMVSIADIFKISARLLPETRKGYDNKCDCDSGFVMLERIRDGQEIAGPCICNKSFNYNYQQMINSGKYRLLKQPTFENIGNYLKKIKGNSTPLAKQIATFLEKVYCDSTP